MIPTIIHLLKLNATMHIIENALLNGSEIKTITVVHCVELDMGLDMGLEMGLDIGLELEKLIKIKTEEAVLKIIFQ